MNEGTLVNFMQTKFSCCGIDSHEDYAKMQFPARHEGEPFPYSCCHLKEGNTWGDPDMSDVTDLFLCQSLHPDALHDQGCLEPFQNWIKTKATFMIAYGSIMFVLSGLLFSAYAYILYSTFGRPI
jgi:hypothetical protein